MSNYETSQSAGDLAAVPESEASFANESLGESEHYRIWACDNQVYGPIPESILLEWIRDERVLRDTWIYVETRKGWYQAHTIAQLKGAFGPGDDTMFLQKQQVGQQTLDPYELRLFPVLAGLSNHDLADFIRLAEVVFVKRGDFVVRRHEPGDSINFVLSGSARARLLVGREEKFLNRIPAGEFLGEMAMFTQTVRSADVIADEDTRLLKFTGEAFQTLITAHPAAAAPMLYGISRTMAQRILATNNKYQSEVASGFVWR